MSESAVLRQQPTSVVVVASDQSLINKLDVFLNGNRMTHLIGVIRRWDRDSLDQIEGWEPDVLLVQEGMNEGRAKEIARSVKQSRPDVAIFVMVQGREYDDPDYHRELMATATAGVLKLTDEPERSFPSWISPILEAVELHKHFSAQASGGRGWVLAIHSLKGGLGRTLISASLADTLTRYALSGEERERRVLVLDLDWPFGEMEVFLNLAPAHSTLDLIPVMNSLTRNDIESATTSHLRPNLQALVPCLESEQLDYLQDVLEEDLFSPQYDGVIDDLLGQVRNANVYVGPDPIDAPRRDLLDRMLRKAKSKQVVVQLVRQLITRASRYYDYVLVDLPPRIDELTLYALRGADRILLICTPDVPAIRATRTELNVLPRLAVPDERIRLILNRVRRDGEIRSDEVRALFEGREWLADIPEDHRIEPLVNTSILATEVPQLTQFAIGIRQLAEAILADRGASH